MNAAAVLVALVLDATLREPPLPVHPVRVIGVGLDHLARWAPAGTPRRSVVRGGVAWLVGVSASTALAVGLDRGVRRFPPPVAAAMRGLALWPLVSLALLVDEVAAVEAALADASAQAGELTGARRAVGRLVSRDVSDADETQIRTAAIASLAENVSDAFIAPLCWFAAFGLPGAATYRFINTADAMWGYRDARWRHAGRIAARADDVANLLPARLTGLVLAGGGPTLAVLRREARRTPSPNGGWPMAAVALQLGIRCDKPGTYALHAGGRPAQVADTVRALRLVRRRALLLGLALALASNRRAPCRR